MDSSVEENTTNIISSGKSSYLTQIIMNKVKSMIGFFSMSENEMVQAGIDSSETHMTHDQDGSDIRSESPFAQDNRKIL